MLEDLEVTIHTIAVVGGTGKEGKGLAYRLAKAGYRVLIGSRSLERAQAAAAEVAVRLEGKGDVSGVTNPEAVLPAEVVVITVPYSAHRETLAALKTNLQGKLVVDVTVPLVPPKVSQVFVPEAGSAAQETRQILGDNIQVVSAFQNISHENLWNDQPVECDVLVVGTSKAARAAVIHLVQAIGLVGWDAGPLENAVVVEWMTSILIGLNKQYHVKSSGIHITGIPR